jgi:hypothetical protein
MLCKGANEGQIGGSSLSFGDRKRHIVISLFKRVCRLTGFVLLWLFLLVVTGWSVLVVCYAGIRGSPPRIALAAVPAVCLLVLLAGVALRRSRRYALIGFLVLFGLLLGWWQTTKPSNDRPWQPEVAVLSYASIDGDLVTVHNIRNFDYRSETDFTPAYYDKTFDLRGLKGVDLVTSYWMGPAIAHTFVSFDFGKQGHLAISIESRKAKGQAYSSILGFFRNYELYYVVADERDVIRLRTNYRRDPPEDVYLYRVRTTAQSTRRIFLDYLKTINALKRQPEFYNTLTDNCTNSIWLHARVNPGHLPFSWKILLSGHVPAYLYEEGRLDTRLPFDELQRRSHINEKAQAADDAIDFSQRIRAGLPQP